MHCYRHSAVLQCRWDRKHFDLESGRSPARTSVGRVGWNSKSVPSALWDWRGCSESYGTQKPSHVMFSAVFVGLKCLSGVELVFSHSSTFWQSYSTKLAFCTCWSSGSWKVCQQANSSFPNGRVKTLHRIFLTFRHLSESQFKTQCFRKVPGYVEACWPLCKTWGAFAVTQPQDPLC